MINVVSFSGGRTSAYMLNLIRNQDPSSKFIFMDTGAEHPETYVFIRKVVEHWGIDLTCLRVLPVMIDGVGSDYEIINYDQCKQDLIPWQRMLSKYGHPYVGGAFCTDRMKTVPFTKYCKDHFGKDNYKTWIGIRYDEPARLWGDSSYDALISIGISQDRASELFVKAIKTARLMGAEYANQLIENYIPKVSSAFDLCCERIAFIINGNLNFLAEIDESEKADILEWWEEQPFDLDLQEHKGNCVFCIKKSLQKVALAAKDEPEMAEAFWNCLVSYDKKDDKVMYRRKHTFQEVIALFDDNSRDELASRMRSMKQYETGACSESCEAFGGGNA